MSKVAVLGAGSWGNALAIVLADNGHDVRLWTHRKEQADEINNTHRNEKYLQVDLPHNLKAYHDLEVAIQDVEAIVFVVPSSAIREVSRQVKDMLPKDVTIVHAAKGIEPNTFKRISELIAEEIPTYHQDDIVVLSGRSAEHTSELQSRGHLVCRLLHENRSRVELYLHDP